MRRSNRTETFSHTAFLFAVFLAHTAVVFYDLAGTCMSQSVTECGGAVALDRWHRSDSDYILQLRFVLIGAVEAMLDAPCVAHFTAP